MKTYNDVQVQIEKLETMKIDLDKEIQRVGRYSPIGINMGKQYDQFDADIKTLKWVIS